MKKIFLFSVVASLLLFTACKKDKTKEDSKDNSGENPTTPTALVINTGIASIDALANDMVKVQGGTFEMGSDSSEFDQEKPQHKITLSDFYICKYEVTQELWQAVMESVPTAYGGWTDQIGKGNKYPAYRISWNDCDTFIQRLNAKTGLNFRLPTEAEWEYAARGGSKSNGYTYAGSDTLENVAWCRWNSNNTPHMVMQMPANELGLYDMTGNVGEWCCDWYESDYYTKSAGATNPTGPTTGIDRVCRGGNFITFSTFSRVWSRSAEPPTESYQTLGFRIVLVP